MKKRLWKQVMAMLMALVIVLSQGNLSLAYWEEEWHDDWEEVCQCDNCGEILYHAEDICDCDAGKPHCSESNSSCWEEYHCKNHENCGNTKDDGTICDDCGFCAECWYLEETAANHCSECNTCGAGVCHECADPDNEKAYCEDCAIENGLHCKECGQCFQNVTVCDKSVEEDEVAMCMECCEAAGNHCSICHEHYDGGCWCPCDSGPEDHCIFCADDAGTKFCDGCHKYFCPYNGDDLSSDYCENCDLCMECCLEQIKHCPICGQEVDERCESDGEHCKECCDVCEQCERCLLVEVIERCEQCDLCLECCRENAEEAGCSCGEFCREESGFEEHLCEECGRCFGENPRCDYCGLCLECCAEKSEEEGCSDGMCVDDPDFADHFCDECKECFHSVDRCEICEAAGVNVCEECCIEISATLGCDHGICSNSDYWKCHFDAENGECYVNEDAGEDQHDFRDSTTCYVCGAQRDGTPHILVQPKDRSVKVGKDAASAEKVTLSVTAQGFNLTYQWYNGLGNKLTEDEYYKGVNTNTLTICQTTCYADIDAAIAKAEAENDFSKANMLTQIKKGMNTFYCVVTNSESNRSATSATATVMTKHNVTEYRADVENHNYHYNSVSYKPQNGEAVNLSWKTTATHSKVCVGSYWNLDNEDGAWRKALGACDKHEASEPHVWTGWNYNTEYPAYKGQTGYASRNCMVCKAVEYKAYEYVEPHEHVWANQYEPIVTTIKQKDSQGNVTLVPYNGYHARRCTVEGCPEYTPKEEHVWSEYEITTAATDHSEGERVRHCLACGYEERETLAVLYHKHDFPVKHPVSGWYELEDERDYVGHTNRGHYVTCRGVVLNEKTGEYEPCKERSNFEPHAFTIKYLDGEISPNAWGKFELTCRCGFSKTYKSEGNANTEKGYKLFSTFPNFKWEYGGETYYSDQRGNAVNIPYKAQVTIYNETGYRFSARAWEQCIYTVDDGYIQILDSDFYSVTFKMPMRDVFVDFNVLDPATQLSGWECPHSTTYYDESTAIETTCTKSGKEPDLKCSDCHVTLEIGETQAALGHNFILDKSTVVIAGCTTRGYTGDSICSNCGKVQRGVSLPADGHEIKEGYYYWDDSKHWPYCTECEKEFKAQAEKHVFGTLVSNGVTYEYCTRVGCDYYRVKLGEETGTNYAVSVVTNDRTDNTDLTFRLYPATVSDADILKDMEKTTSELGTEYGCFMTWQGKASEGYTRSLDYEVLNLPRLTNDNGKNYKFAVTLGKDYIPVVKSYRYVYGVCYVCLKEFSVSFDANGGTGNMQNVTVKSGEKYTLPECGFSSTDGKTFLGWTIMTTAGTILQSGLQPGTPVTIDRDVICKAAWSNGIWITGIRLDPGSNPSKGGRIFVDAQSVEDLMGTDDELMMAYIDEEYEYAWFADGAKISGKTGSSLTVTDDLSEKTIFAVLKIAGHEYVTDKIVVNKICQENPNLKIEKKSLTLYDTIAIDFKISENVVKDYQGVYLMVTQSGLTEKMTDYRTEGGMLIFTFRVAPHMMGEVVTAVPYALNINGETIRGEVFTYSVAQYCYNMLGKEAYQDAKYATLRRLLVDILIYGDAAQLYAGYKTTELASKDLTAVQRAMGTDVSVPMTYESVKDKTFATVDASDALASLEAASLYLEAAVNIQFKYVADNLTGLRIVVTGDAAGADVLGEYAANANQIDNKGRYYVNFGNLNAGEMKKTVYATVMQGNKKVSNTYRYSIESYAASMKNSGVPYLDNLLDSMMRYGNTAADYVAGR
ncbi:MAG: InlB B-repeat-containing protein [Lachnospiraceae bacterium]|nr:InlB B-repeat-containing protein [Lachnospiraceae bacterium]